MTEEVKDTKVEETKIPAEIGESQPKAPKAEENKTIGEPVISERDKLRQSIETKVAGEPSPLPPEIPEKVEETEEEPEKPLEVESDADRLKAKIQKRIGKEVAKRKTLEEQLAEKEAEIERLRTAPASEPKSKEPEKEPTNADIAAALKKAREEGDTDFEVEILDYIAEKRAKKERAEAEKSFEDRNTQVTERQRKWGEIVQDYTVTDDKGEVVKDHPLNLANPQSQLYKTANALYLDPDLKKQRYSQGSEMENLRRAISDAYIELSKMGVEKPKTQPIQEGKTAKERQKTALVEPSAASAESSEPKKPAKPMTEQEKVLDEVKSRVKYKREREAALY